jgi:hypothetical protein
MYKDPTGEANLLGTPETEREFYAQVTIDSQEAYAILGRCPIVINDQPTQEECAQLMGGARGQNYRDAWMSVLGGSERRMKQVQAKWNEQIGKGIPRVIVSFNTEHQVRVMQWARAMTKAVKSFFNGQNIIHIAGRPIRFVVAEASADALDLYGELFSDSVPLVVVSCDDTVVYGGDDLKPPFLSKFIETDYSMYDQSVTDPHWKRIIATWLGWGASEEWAQELLWSILSAFRAGKRGERLTGSTHVLTPTGSSVTSIIGSLVNLANWINAILKGISIEESSKQFGFTIKSEYKDTYMGNTFLRGWWNATPSGALGWSNLPSLSLKLGKLFRDPATISKVNSHAVVFRAIMDGVTVPDDYPILGAMRRLSRRLADHDEHARKVLVTPTL